MRTFKLFVGIVSFCALGATSVFAQSGDQILDGIGETGLIARYIFKGDVKDWSRNNLHASIQGSDFKFVEDELFGNVLSLPGDSAAFISIPVESVTGQESLSITGWIYLRSTKSGQLFFDFGKNKMSHFFVAPVGTKDTEGYQAQIITKSDKNIASSPAVTVNKWNHLAIVINVPSKTLNTYLNGVLVSEAKNVTGELEQIFDNNSGEINKFYVGKSMTSDNSYLNAKLHDFRIYRIPLSERQITRIHDNSLKKEEAVVRTRGESDRSLPKFSETTPQLYNSYLTSVPDIRVETAVGDLPRLPRYVHGVYSNKTEGPNVRVLWPAPLDNSQVLTPGTYKVTGRISGTSIQPNAIVKVKETKELATPGRKLEVFKLDQVSLNTDLHNNKTKFIENRDKFMTGLANTNPDNFLYMFRNAFGQEQPKGAEPLGGWDSQQTKLRGHATGHYLSAIAQAYASAGYDTSLKANFAGKMEYMYKSRAI